jgi:hypothetical protein
MNRLSNLHFIDAIGAQMILLAKHQLIINLFLMILVRKFLVIFIRATIQQFLLMDKQVQENHIQFKDMKRKGYYNYV